MKLLLGLLSMIPALCLAAGERGVAAAAPSSASSAVVANYAQHCAVCHGIDRLGGTGPALLPENLARLRRSEAEKVIAGGRVATQMAGFSDRLRPEEIRALSEWIYTPAEHPPAWGEKEILASRVVHADAAGLPARPVFKADPMNLFVVVETGDHHATLLDGDRFEPIHRFQTRFALHGGPKFSPDGRFVYFASRDGWVSKYDIYNLKMVAEVRVGINTRNLAVSGDGRYVLAGNYLPHSVVLLDASDLSLLRVMPAVAASGRSSRVSAVYDAAPRKSFIVALKDAPETWELSYGTSDGKTPGAPRVIGLPDVLDDFFFDQSYTHLIGAARDGVAQVVDLDRGKAIASLALAGMPHLGSGITWEEGGRSLLATPNLKDGLVSIIDMRDWRVIKEVKTSGPGFFMRSHENTPYAWVDGMMGKRRDTLQLIDKRTLEVAGEVTPVPGKTLAHIEFTRDGRYALASLWEEEGALIVYDAATLREVKRLPMSKPSGKYNVYNKTTRSSGTSH